MGRDWDLNALAVAAAIAATIAAAAITASGDDSLHGESRLHLVGIAADGCTAVAAIVRAGRDSGEGADENALQNKNSGKMSQWPGGILGQDAQTLTMNFIILMA